MAFAECQHPNRPSPIGSSRPDRSQQRSRCSAENRKTGRCRSLVILVRCEKRACGDGRIGLTEDRIGSEITNRVKIDPKNGLKRRKAKRTKVLRRGGRAADCAALEMLCPRKGTEGSNPSLSAYIALTLRSCCSRVVLAGIACWAPGRKFAPSNSMHPYRPVGINLQTSSTPSRRFGGFGKFAVPGFCSSAVSCGCG